MVGIFPNYTSIFRLVGSQLLEQQEECQLERRRFFSEATIAKISVPKESLELEENEPSSSAATAAAGSRATQFITYILERRLLNR